jgi:hypothetical protein
MSMLSSLRLPALFLAVALLVAGCDGFDSGTPPTAATGDEGGATVSFTESSFSAVESAGTISIGVTITNPPNDTVTAEVLYADAASATDPSDFNLQDSEQVGSGRVAGTVVFPDTATTGNTQTLELNIQDDEPSEEREEGIFVLQQVRNATVGSTNQLAVTIGAIQVFFENFSDGLAPFSAVSLQSNENWGTGSDGDPPNAPYAVVSGFDANEASDDWLISPACDFETLEEETLTFLNAFGFSDSIRGLNVKVSTDYDGGGDSTSVANATWTDVSDQVTFSDGDFNFVESGDVDLSAEAFQSESTYIAFQYLSSGTGSGQVKDWQVDNVALTSSTQPEGAACEAQ